MRGTLQDIRIVQNRHGLGVVATRNFRRGECITEFTGQRLTKAEAYELVSMIGDRIVQIGIDTYMGPSGSFDDIINHSCEPNVGHFFRNGRMFCHALRDIKKDEEFFWDYSTTLVDDDWTMECACGSERCRGVVREFPTLPVKLQRTYEQLGIVPQYVLARTRERLLVPVKRRVLKAEKKPRVMRSPLLGQNMLPA